MGRPCDAGQYWDSLIKRCMNCRLVCQQPQLIARCTSYCESASCNALAGHYYDGLINKCVRCSAVCGRHPAECAQHCQALTTPVLLAERPNSRSISPPTAMEHSTVLLYSLLALCMVLLFSSLTLAVVVFLRVTRGAQTTKAPGAKGANRKQECVVQLGQEVGYPGHRSKDPVTNSSRAAEREPSEDSIPTETCVCVHCFPHLKAIGQASERPSKASSSIYPNMSLHNAQIQNAWPVWTEGQLHACTLECQEEAALG